MVDGVGLQLFLSALAEMAQGLASPSIPPSWERHLLDAGYPPRVTLTHHEYDQVESTTDDTVQLQRSFFFGPEEMYSLYQLLPPHLRQCSKFELLTACLWRCRTIALNLDPDQDVRLIIAVDARSKFNPPLPSGYYGHSVVGPAAKTTSAKLVQNPLEYVVELVKKTKRSVTEEYVRSVAGLMVLNSKRITFPQVGSFLISDVTHIGFGDVDFGWGKARDGARTEGWRGRRSRRQGQGRAGLDSLDWTGGAVVVEEDGRIFGWQVGGGSADGRLEAAEENEDLFGRGKREVKTRLEDILLLR